MNSIVHSELTKVVSGSAVYLEFIYSKPFAPCYSVGPVKELAI
jgi:hypothetical protein